MLKHLLLAAFALFFSVISCDFSYADANASSSPQTFVSAKSGQSYTIYTAQPGESLSAALRLQIKDVVVGGLGKAYEKLTPKAMGIQDKFSSIHDFLINLIRKELVLFDEGKRTVFYVTTHSNKETHEAPQEEVVAFLSVTYEDGDLHLTECSVAPKYQRQGIATELLCFVQSMFPDARVMSLETRVLNKESQAFFQARQFDKEGQPRAPYSPEHYVGYQKKLG